MRCRSDPYGPELHALCIESDEALPRRLARTLHRHPHNEASRISARIQHGADPACILELPTCLSPETACATQPVSTNAPTHRGRDASVPAHAHRPEDDRTIATLVELSRIGVPSSRVRLLFNMVDDRDELERSFHPLLRFVSVHPIAKADPACWLGENEIYGRLKTTGMDIGELVRDTTDYKALIAKAGDSAEKLAVAHKLATRRLAHGVQPELDACFAALALESALA